MKKTKKNRKLPTKKQQEVLFNFINKNYNNSLLIDEIKKNIQNEEIIFLDLTESTEAHILLFLKLFFLDEKLFKNYIVIVSGDNAFRATRANDNKSTLIFLIKGGDRSIGTSKKPPVPEFSFFCKRLVNMFYDKLIPCVYCLEDFDNNFYTCNNCSSLICYDCFKTDFLKNGDTLRLNNKECSICKTRGNFVYTTDINNKAEIEEQESKMELDKLYSILYGHTF